MNKLNNKGMTIVELLVALSLTLVLIIGMFNLITSVRSDLENKRLVKSYGDYSNIINNKIHSDLVKNKPFAVIYKNDDAGSFSCHTLTNVTCQINENNISIIYSGKTSNINVSNVCLNNHPCLIYSYFDNENISFNSIALKQKDEYGILYNGVLETMPNKEHIKFLNDKEENKTYIKVDENGFLIINFPFYMIGNTKNLGFKIAYPFLEQ